MNTNSENVRPVRLRDRLRDEVDRTILAAAEEVFSEEGLSAKVEKIAARAGVAVGTLYNHFADREALATALARARRDSLLSRLDAALSECDGRPVEDQLRAFVSAVAEHGKAHGRYLSMLVQAGEGPARAHPGHSLLEDLLSRVDVIAARGIASGELRPEGREVYGLALLGMIRLANVRILEGAAKWESLAGPLVDLFLRGAAR
ncbi:MAG TPA: TetR/AcrR family transcriptional regulator [Anaeromyxobacter sp.]|nr:TetR/AcrR family transcriptional regulator [Anaeromyxobacter sp.]